MASPSPRNRFNQSPIQLNENVKVKRKVKGTLFSVSAGFFILSHHYDTCSNLLSQLKFYATKKRKAVSPASLRLSDLKKVQGLRFVGSWMLIWLPRKVPESMIQFY